ncbi:formate--tetrahydrofolate ligase [Reinekea sp. G2M2-21]|uniref:formate--tetrahydrofolate ligase n=1 Tax=Reinekea sp. G2M2-21 TaxID=2788942 RepID=UPI0018A92590|nr:formate--tetrahydrofolate ligase [Reinekea sp. G2M2-21]
MTTQQEQHTSPKTDLDIARQAPMKRIVELARETLGIDDQHLEPYGHYKAKISLDYLHSISDRPDGKLILVTAISPTPAGEGKTTLSVGLTDALNELGKKTIVCLREPSLGPCFGMKGGAAGGGYAQVVPMEDINLHFTGDFHAIGAANNLLAAMIDNHVNWHHNDETCLDNRRITWRRVVDINDRSLREIVTSLGGVNNGAPREGGFDITVASEVMAILCLATDLKDLERRLGNIIVGYDRKNNPVRANQIKAQGAMTVLLKDAIKPNLVQTLENNLALIHGGPFANIAHGCNSLIATQAALKMADYVVTEAGFGADLGAEKFFNIKCRKGNLNPELAVVVATIRALKMHGGVDKSALNTENLIALERGCANLKRHVQNMKRFGVNVVIAINRFTSDTPAEREQLLAYCEKMGVKAVETDHWAQGGKGALVLAETVLQQIANTSRTFKTLYPDDMFLWNKISMIATELYGASEIVADQKIRDQIRAFQDDYGHFPICMAKTQYSFSTDPQLRGAPENHVVPIREIRLAAGAEFLVVICGDIMTMPGLPSEPAANNIRIDENGHIAGLF